MFLIERYLLRQLLTPTLGTVAALCGVAILGQGLSTFDVIVDQRQSALTFLQLVLLALPQVIVMILPICLFVGTLLAFNRLHTEQEIVAGFAGGVSRWRVVAPAMRLAVVATLSALLVNLFIQPVAYRTMRDKLFAVRTDLVSVLIREGEFTHPAEGLTVYAESAGAGGRLGNVLISEKREDGGDQTFSAAEGRIADQNGRPTLLLRYGTQNSLTREGVLNVLAFDEYAFDLSPYVNSGEALRYKISDRFLHELVFPDLRQAWERENREKMLAEAHYRLSSPLYCLAFTLLAITAVIGGGFSRIGYTRRILAFGGLAALVRIVGFGVQSAAAETPWLNLLQYVIPLATFWWTASVLFRSCVRERGPTLAGVFPAVAR